MSIDVRAVTGAEIGDLIDDLAGLRITVFRDWPYLYDGDRDYERQYLAAYQTSPGAVVVGAFDAGRLVGAATGTPMEDHAAEFGAAFAGAGIDLADLFYCAESVLLPAYRGRGIGKAFFAHREAHACALNRRYSTFCAVERPSDHPARPAGYVPLDAFWTTMGYARRPDLRAAFSWRDVGEAAATEKPMQYWLKEL